MSHQNVTLHKCDSSIAPARQQILPAKSMLLFCVPKPITQCQLYKFQHWLARSTKDNKATVRYRRIVQPIHPNVSQKAGRLGRKVVANIEVLFY